MPESMDSTDVRGKLVDALRLDLVGPSDNLGDPSEVLPQAPSRWYLTGFLVPLEDLVDLVTTGPGSSDTASRDTSVVVRDLFHNARTSVVVVGYAVHQGQKVFQALADRMMEFPGLQVRMYLDIQREAGDTSAPSELVKRFVHRFRTFQWPAGKPLPQVFYDPRSLELDHQNRAALHAKCIVVDARHLFVSSANFTEAAQQRNIEVGIFLESPVIADRLLRFLNALVEGGHLRCTL